MSRADRYAQLPMVGFAAFFSLIAAPRVFPALELARGYFLYLVAAVLLGCCLFVVAGVAAVTVALNWRRRDSKAFVASARCMRVAGVGLASFLVAGTLRFVLGQPLPFSSYVEPFDRTQWLAPDADWAPERGATPRQRMLGDVVERVLPGRTGGQIEAELGPSLDSPYFRKSGRDMIYYLGPERGFFRIDSEWLLIWLDSQGKFSRYRLARD